MTTLVTILHVVVSFVLIVVILLQAGKGGGMGAAFGGGAGSVFGGRGATTFLGKVTSACAAIFMITSLTLSFLASRSTSVIRADGAPPPSAQQPAPASPLTAPGQGGPAAPAAPAEQAPAAPTPAQGSAPAAPTTPAK